MDSKTATELSTAIAEVELLKLRFTALENVLQFRDPDLFAAYSREIANLETGKTHQMFLASLAGLKKRLQSG